MGNHYLPQHYLRGFATISGSNVWTHDRTDGRAFCPRIRDIAHETNLYPEALEARLNVDIEQPGSAVIDKLRARQPITTTEKLALARYMVTLWKRVPRARQRVKERMPAAAAELEAGVSKGLDDLVQQEPHLAARAEERKREVAGILERIKDNPPLEIWHKSIESYTSSQVAAMVASMKWRYCVCTSGSVITSDNPVFFFENEGIGNKHGEVSFPISSDTVLWACRKMQPDDDHVAMPKHILREFNRRSIANATRFVFSQTEEQWILTMLAKPRIRLNRIQ